MSSMDVALLVLSASTVILFLMLVWQNRRHAECRTDARFDEIHREIGRVWDQMDDKIARSERDINDRIDGIERAIEGAMDDSLREKQQS